MNISITSFKFSLRFLVLGFSLGVLQFIELPLLFFVLEASLVVFKSEKPRTKKNVRLVTSFMTTLLIKKFVLAYYQEKRPHTFQTLLVFSSKRENVCDLVRACAHGV